MLEWEADETGWDGEKERGGRVGDSLDGDGLEGREGEERGLDLYPGSVGVHAELSSVSEVSPKTSLIL